MKRYGVHAFNVSCEYAACVCVRACCARAVVPRCTFCGWSLPTGTHDGDDRCTTHNPPGARAQFVRIVCCGERCRIRSAVDRLRRCPCDHCDRASNSVEHIMREQCSDDDMLWAVCVCCECWSVVMHARSYRVNSCQLSEHVLGPRKLECVCHVKVFHNGRTRVPRIGTHAHTFRWRYLDNEGSIH